MTLGQGAHDRTYTVHDGTVVRGRTETEFVTHTVRHSPHVHSFAVTLLPAGAGGLSGAWVYSHDCARGARGRISGVVALLALAGDGFLDAARAVHDAGRRDALRVV